MLLLPSNLSETGTGITAALPAAGKDPFEPSCPGEGVQPVCLAGRLIHRCALVDSGREKALVHPTGIPTSSACTCLILLPSAGTCPCAGCPCQHLSSLSVEKRRVSTQRERCCDEPEYWDLTFHGLKLSQVSGASQPLCTAVTGPNRTGMCDPQPPTTSRSESVSSVPEGRAAR